MKKKRESIGPAVNRAGLLKKFAPTLRLLSKPKLCPVIKTLILRGGCSSSSSSSSSKHSLLDCLSECALNILKGNVSLTAGEKRQLSRHKETLRLLARRDKHLQRKKAVAVQQRGGFLGALLAPLAGLIGSLLFSK